MAISLTLGDNGLFKRALNAVDTWEIAEENEQKEMDKMAELIDNYADGINIKQVTDKNPGKLEIDEQNIDTYIINSIEDLIFLAYDVKQGNYYEGKTIKLGLSLDFNSNKSYVDAYRTDYDEFGYTGKLKEVLAETGFIPIGTAQSSNGSEEINEKSFKGIFDGNGNVTTNNNSRKYCAMALLVGNNRVGGIIRNCYTTGKISCMSSNGYNISRFFRK